MPRDLYASGLAWLWGQLRTAFDQSDTTATIEARAPADGGWMDSTPTWTATHEDVPCLLRPLRAERVERQGRDASKTWVEIYFREDYGITRGDRITVGGKVYSPDNAIDLDSGGQLYRVDCTLNE
jgi:hypothetical protein